MRTLILCGCLLAAAPVIAGNPGVPSSGIKEASKQLKSLQQRRDTLQFIAANDPADLRGRRQIDDFNQFALTSEVEEKVSSLLKTAGGKTDEAKAAFEEAQKLLRRADAQAADIDAYWDQDPGISWRERWRVFAEANGLSPDPPDPGLVKTESSMLEHLADGKFYYPATIDAPLLSILVNDAMRKASNELALAKDRELRFIPRTTQCGKSQGSGRGSARIARAVNPDAYFPPAALRRDEEGSIVLRARIAPTNCATHVAIVASSGYPVLDEAAIKVFEATTFQAAVDEDGKPKESEFTFKVMFALRRPSR